VSSSQAVILFSPLPVGACRSRLEDASLPARDSSIAGRVSRRGVELWRRHSIWRFFQPTLAVQCFEADERTRLETEMRVSKSGFSVPLAYVLGTFLSLVIAAVGSIPIAFFILGAETAVVGALRGRASRNLSTDGPFLRAQLGRLVHATEPAR
jgi:hypothetical protein